MEALTNLFQLPDSQSHWFSFAGYWLVLWSCLLITFMVEWIALKDYLTERILKQLLTIWHPSAGNLTPSDEKLIKTTNDLKNATLNSGGHTNGSPPG